MPVVETLQARLPYKNIEELFDMTLNRGYKGIKANTVAELPSKRLTAPIGEMPVFQAAITEMAREAKDTPSVLLFHFIMFLFCFLSYVILRIP